MISTKKAVISEKAKKKSTQRIKAVMMNDLINGREIEKHRDRW